jgi:hypothetical protein
MEEFEIFVQEIYRKFSTGSFEFHHLNRAISGYGRGEHVKFHHEGYIEVKGYSGKARVYRLTEKALKLAKGVIQ